MYAEGARATREIRPAQPVVPLDVGAVPARRITVMVASAREAPHPGWLPRLARDPGIRVWGEAVGDAARLATCVERHLPDVLLLDKAMLDALDQASLRRLQAQCRHVRVLLLWDEVSHGVVSAVFRNRFHGFLPTTAPPEMLLKAVRAVSRGELWLSRASLARTIAELLGLPDAEPAGEPVVAPLPGFAEPLTPREAQVVELLRRGCTNKEIAQELGIMEDTVKKHLQGVFAKLGVHRRTLVALRGLPATAA